MSAQVQCRYIGAVEKVPFCTNPTAMRRIIIQSTCRGGLVCPPLGWQASPDEVVAKVGLLKKYRQRATVTACAVNICKPPVGAD